MLELQNITKQFKAGKTIFESFSDSFKDGEFIGLSGPNGSGKTTFLRLLSVNSFPTSGAILYNGVDIHKSPRQYLQDVGLVHDQETLPVHLSAVELLQWVLRSRKMWNGQSEGEVTAMFDKLSLGEDRYGQIGTYSTGMRKKAQIAAACIVKPKILILDEPMRGLDVETREVVENMLRDAKDGGALILMASHTADIKAKHVSRILQFPLHPAR